MNPDVDSYLKDGCGRCSLHATPQCKIHNWRELLMKLRMLSLDSQLKEERKWGVPCYTYRGTNVLMISAFTDNCVLSFLKGSLLDDPQNFLQKPGENTQAGRVMRFYKMQDLIGKESVIMNFIQQAIELEKTGRRVEMKAKDHLIYPDELKRKFEKDKSLKSAFEALTPGRQRGYILYFNAAKQSKTRDGRIEKYKAQILAGKGIHDL